MTFRFKEMESIISIALQEGQHANSKQIEEFLDNLKIQYDKDSYKSAVAVQNNIAVFKPLGSAELIINQLQNQIFMGKPLIVNVLQRKVPRKRNCNAIVIRTKGSAQEVTELLEKHKVKVVTMKQSQQSDSFHVRLESEEAAREAIELLKGEEINGKRIGIHIAH
ncbi:Nucleotide-binding_alpha-beta plait domain superfamily [Hexamita inflata]|uniref:Nucleotide-binding alpha-beta plait domain superfamily n=1 Tax=Hexamita inflata TaxID=28002 RepID=A0AA86U1J4_9EUKA|nr:Nucleotide-binding alpha-beta plait domain superfamily [Hexamita inflata]